MAGNSGQRAEEPAIRLWEAATGRELAVLDPGDGEPSLALAFLPGGRLVLGGLRGVRVWDIESRTFRPLWTPAKDAPQGVCLVLAATPDGRVIFAYSAPPRGAAYVADSVTGAVMRLDSHGDHAVSVAVNAAGTVIATCSMDGIVRVGSASGEAPHLLLGQSGPIAALAVSPAGDWIVSGGLDTTVRLWPMPDLSKPPAHTLPLAELLAKLKSQTNLRVIADPAAPNGYRTEPGPFPGWAVVPEWEP